MCSSEVFVLEDSIVGRARKNGRDIGRESSFGPTQVVLHRVRRRERRVERATNGRSEETNGRRRTRWNYSLARARAPRPRILFRLSSVILLIRVRIILARKRELERIGFGADINFARSTAASPKRMSRTPTLNYIRSHDFFSDNIDRNPTNIVDFSKIPATTFFLFFYPPPSAIREQSYYYAFGIKKASRGISSSNS